MNTNEAPIEHNPTKIHDELLDEIIRITQPDREDLLSHSDEWRAVNLGKFNLIFDDKVANEPGFLAKCELDLHEAAQSFEVMLIGHAVQEREDAKRAA